MNQFYTLLNVQVTSSAEEIKKAYHQLAQRYHPDKNKGDLKAAAMFRQVKEAYEWLKKNHQQIFTSQTNQDKDGQFSSQEEKLKKKIAQIKKVLEQNKNKPDIITNFKYQLMQYEDALKALKNKSQYNNNTGYGYNAYENGRRYQQDSYQSSSNFDTQWYDLQIMNLRHTVEIQNQEIKELRERLKLKNRSFWQLIKDKFMLLII